MATDYEPKPPRNYRKDIIGAALVLGLLGFGIGVVALQRFEEAAARRKSTANLKNLGLAVNIWESKHQILPHPTGNMSPMGPSKLSWRVDLLPYLEEQELYKQFHHDEEWDSPHNLPLLARMPKVYLDPRFQNPEDQSSGLTYYQTFTGKETAMERKGDPGRPMTEVVDGQYQPDAILFVEAGEPVPWTKPDDLEYDPGKPLPKLGGPKGDTFFAVLCGGKVIPIPAGTSDLYIRAGINCEPNDLVHVRPPWR